MAIANALQLEAARGREVPIRCSSSTVPSLNSISLSVAFLERFDGDTLRYAVTLTFDPLELELLWYFRRHVFKLHTKFEQNRTIRGRVIDHLARFRRSAVLGVGHFLRTVLRGAWTELHQTWREYREIIAAFKICFRVEIFCIIFKREW